VDPLEWMLEFVDRISAPAKAMSLAVRGLVVQLRDLEKVFDRLIAKGRALESMFKRAAGVANAAAKISTAVDKIERAASGGSGRSRNPEAERLRQERAAQKEIARASRLAERQTKMAEKEAAKIERMATRKAEKEANVAARIAARGAKIKEREGIKAAKQAERIRNAGPGSKTISWSQAKEVFSGSGQNFEIFKGKLQGLGVSAMDSALLVRKLRRELEGSRKEAMKLGEGGWLATFRRNIWTLSHTLNVFKTAAGAVYGAPQQVYGVGSAGIGAVLDSAQFRENTLVSFQEMLKPFYGEEGKKGAAVEMFGKAQKFAVETPMETHDVVEGYNSFLGAGVDPMHVEKMFASGADVFAKYGKSAYDSYLHGMVKMQALGKVNQDTLTEMAAGSHLNLTQVYASLGKMAGFKGDEDQVREQVIKKLGKGEFHSTAGQWAAMTAMSGGEDFGGFAKKQSETLTGSISNLKSSLTDLMESTDMSKWPGISELKETIKWLTEQIKPGSAYGERLLKSIERVVNALFGGLEGIRASGIEGVIGFIEDASVKIAKALDQAWDALLKISGGGGLDDLGSMLSNTFENLGGLVGKGFGMALVDLIPWIVENTIKAIPAALNAVGSGAAGLGMSLGQSLGRAFPNVSSAAATVINPVLKADAWATEKIIGMFGSGGGGAPAPVPSGGESSSDAPIPAYDSGGRVPGPTGRKVMAWVRGGERWEGMGSSSRGGFGGGGGNNITVENYNYFGDMSDGDAEDSLARSLEQSTSRGVLRALERLGSSQGVF